MHAFLFGELFNQAFQKPLWEGARRGRRVNRNCGNKRKKRVNIEKKKSSNVKLKKDSLLTGRRLFLHRATAASTGRDVGV